MELRGLCLHKARGQRGGRDAQTGRRLIIPSCLLMHEGAALAPEKGRSSFWFSEQQLFCSQTEKSAKPESNYSKRTKIT
ncbi:uncharacterized [Tachysurus ichikawai]